VFLDDAFAGQDAATEEHILHALFNEKGLFREMGITVVCITSTGMFTVSQPLAPFLTIYLMAC
jgi:hypothetical protein